MDCMDHWVEDAAGKIQTPSEEKACIARRCRLFKSAGKRKP